MLVLGKLVSLLLEKGADKGVVNKENQTPQQCALNSKVRLVKME